MRVLILSFLAVLASDCTCAPDAPVAVTFRVRNTGVDPLYFDDSEGRLGLEVRRGSDTVALAEQRCECEACETLCGNLSCVCPQPSPRAVRRLDPGASAERIFAGETFTDFLIACEGTRLDCKNAENLPVNETLTLRLCFVNERPTGFPAAPDGGSAPGRLPDVGQICVDKPFRIADGVVEIGPVRGSTCTQDSECSGAGELCFDGSCTASCPANGFPELGASWSLRIPGIDDQGFFARTTAGEGDVYAGTGTLTSVLYQGQTMKLELSRAGADGEPLRGTVFVSMPPGFAAPLPSGAQVAVRVIDRSRQTPDNRAITIRDATGALIFAADTAQPGPLLSGEGLSPFTVSREADVIGCREDACGKLLYSRTRFAVGTDGIALAPGASADKSFTPGLYQLVNVGNGRYAKTTCTYDDLSPWMLWKR